MPYLYRLDLKLIKTTITTKIEFFESILYRVFLCNIMEVIKEYMKYAATRAQKECPKSDRFFTVE